MQKDYQYLHTSTKELWWRYGALYVLLLSAAISYGKPLLQTTFWYWLICGTLFFVEYKGTYFLIKDGKLSARVSFKNIRDIPLDKILTLKKGKDVAQIFQPEGIELFFKDEKGLKKSFVLTFWRFEPKEIAKFISDITVANPNISVDEEIHTWLSKNLNVTASQKIRKLLFPGRSTVARKKVFHKDIGEQAKNGDKYS